MILFRGQNKISKLNVPTDDLASPDGLLANTLREELESGDHMLSATVEMILPIYIQFTGDISITIVPGRQDSAFSHPCQQRLWASVTLRGFLQLLA